MCVGLLLLLLLREVLGEKGSKGSGDESLLSLTARGASKKIAQNELEH